MHTIYVLLVSPSPKIEVRFALQLAILELQAILTQNYRKMTMNTTKSRVSYICVTIVSLDPNCSSFPPKATLSSCRPFWQNVLRMIRKVAWIRHSQNYPHTCVTSTPPPPPSPKSHFFRSTTSRFWVAGHFETSAPDDPEMTLNTTMSNVPYICVTNVLSFKFVCA